MQRSSYLYSPLGPDEFRLVRLLPDADEYAVIRCQLLVGRFGEVDFLYESLSYSWGDPQATYVIVVDNVEFPITANLYATLRGLRQQDVVRMLWVDALCINQADVVEKSKQVRHMRHIFQQGAQVLAWLSDSDELMDRVIACLKNAVTQGSPLFTQQRDIEGFLQNNNVQMQDIFALLQLKWFRRLWVIDFSLSCQTFTDQFEGYTRSCCRASPHLSLWTQYYRLEDSSAKLGDLESALEGTGIRPAANPATLLSSQARFTKSYVC
jgi:hypothetical protein